MPARCPYINKPCREHDCTHWVQLHGTDPQTGDRLSDWMCLDHAMLKVALEGNKEVRQGAAAIESFRNQMTKSASKLAKIARTNVMTLAHGND